MKMLARVLFFALLWGCSFPSIARADLSLKVGPEVFDSLKETREQLLRLMHENERQVDHLLRSVQKDPETHAIISSSSKRSHAFRKLIKEYQGLRNILEKNRKDNIYDTDRQVFSAQISKASEAISKITGYINRLQQMQGRIYEILFIREEALE